jgi:hypothetical protein
VTTSLIVGLDYEQAVEAIRGEAERLSAQCGGVGCHTEVGEASVLVGLSTVGGESCVISIDRAEYDDFGGLKLAQILGFRPAAPPSAQEVAARQVPAPKKRRVKEAA